jgi:Protein of unknown function (DUF3307).
MQAATFAAVWAALYAAHSVGDHWVQTHGQARHKGSPGWQGRAACLAHVATLTAVKAVALGALVTVTGLVLAPAAVAIGLAIDAASHYWADRRTTLVALAGAVGKAEFHGLGDPAAAPTGTGAYALDQSWHIAWLFVAALIVSM